VGVIPVGSLGLGVGDRVECKLVGADLLGWSRGDVRCTFRIEVEEHKILLRLWGDVEPVKVHVGDVVAKKAGRPFCLYGWEIGEMACPIGSRRHGGTVVGYRVAGMVRTLHRKAVGEPQTELRPVGVPWGSLTQAQRWAGNHRILDRSLSPAKPPGAGLI
jgi:hypothetical protein